MDRPKRRDFPWKKSILHFSLCFSAGFLSGLLPSSHFGLLFDPSDRSLRDDRGGSLLPPKLLIVVTTTGAGGPLRGLMVERLARTLRLVPPPLLWIVVGAREAAVETAGMLRMTGVTHRHLVSRENASRNPGEGAEDVRQRRLALEHIERHHLDGIVHFAELGNVYDLDLLEEIRETEVFGTWPVASVSPNKKGVTIEGPICNSSKVLGWHVDINNTFGRTTTPRIGISSFAFNSSILWDSKRWEGSFSRLNYSQDSVEYVRKLAVEDESKIVAFPRDCSHVLLWSLLVEPLD